MNGLHVDFLVRVTRIGYPADKRIPFSFGKGAVRKLTVNEARPEIRRSSCAGNEHSGAIVQLKLEEQNQAEAKARGICVCVRVSSCQPVST